MIRDTPYHGNVYILTLKQGQITFPRVQRQVSWEGGLSATSNSTIEWDLTCQGRLEWDDALNELFSTRIMNLFSDMERHAMDRNFKLRQFKFNIRIYVSEEEQYITSSTLPLTDMHQGGYGALVLAYQQEVLPLIETGISETSFAGVLNLDEHDGPLRGSDIGAPLRDATIDVTNGFLIIYCVFQQQSNVTAQLKVKKSGRRRDVDEALDYIAGLNFDTAGEYAARIRHVLPDIPLFDLRVTNPIQELIDATNGPGLRYFIRHLGRFS